MKVRGGGGVRGLVLLFNCGSRWGGQRNAPATFPPPPPEWPATHCAKELGGRQGRSGWVRRILPPAEFVPRTVHPVAVCCTGWAIPVTSVIAALKLPRLASDTRRPVRKQIYVSRNLVTKEPHWLWLCREIRWRAIVVFFQHWCSARACGQTLEDCREMETLVTRCRIDARQQGDKTACHNMWQYS